MFSILQYLLPHRLLCQLAYALSRSERPWLKNLLIGAFVRHFAPDMHAAVEPKPLAYPSFNAFFTRALRADARPADPDPRRIVSPCDGTLSVAGRLQEGLLLQAKSHHYTLEALLAGEPDWSARLRGGLYATLYLAPYNYHRVHMPAAGRLSAAWHVPGRAFSVNSVTAARVPRLYARNERVICAFEGELGPFVVILVGALMVASISTVWHGEITPCAASAGVRRLRPATGIDLWQPRAAELGRFNMGSTVILLLPGSVAEWDSALGPGTVVRVGQALAMLHSARAA